MFGNIQKPHYTFGSSAFGQPQQQQQQQLIAMNVDDECLSLSYPGGTCEYDDARWFHCMASYGINSEL
ncbi:unnamed protein product [Penicillium roqueforti FM164]|uniref:Genomic scaffold, ProqFM164S01 n=1 Tax=Penicillium roqueforti (strain FM164) TaxID=1365484 RepID=W6PXM3_PENRF|nr:unnamed protein product [Penicillium roqueforti FM164]